MSNQSDQFEEIVGNLRQPSAWLRVLFMLGFALVLYLIIAPVILILMITQALFSVITGTNNANLRYLGGAIGQYVLQILEFVSYNSETKPFPFSDFPNIDGGTGSSSEHTMNGGDSKVESAAEVDVATAQPEKAAAKGTARKKVAKKKTPSKKQDTKSSDD